MKTSEKIMIESGVEAVSYNQEKRKYIERRKRR
jgi:hypothetical protein